jgi:hypothetical protein
MMSSHGRWQTVVSFSREKAFGVALPLAALWACAALLAFRAPGGVRPSSALGDVAAPAVVTLPVAHVQPTTAPGITESKEGPWGKMQLVPMVLELPDEYATAERALGVYDRWNFADMNRDAAIALMASCGLTADQLAIAKAATWSDAGTSSSVEPPDDLVLALSSESRAKLYTALMADPANKSAIDPSWWRVGRVDFRLRGSELSPESTALLKRLLYAGTNDTLLFNDIKPALRAIGDPAERMRFLKAVTRKRSLMARLTVDANTDTAALAEYWGKGGRQESLLPVLDSLKYNAVAGVENPSRMNIAMLLPPFVQERLYQHADYTQPSGREPDDCYWTAFNFFSVVPDDRVHDKAYLLQLLQREYVKIPEPTQLGDVILLADARGDVLHAANYVADDVIFTKNGMSGRQPWILAPMRDVLTQYSIKNDSLTVGYFRRR